jgi:hypothetical protein
VGDFQPGHLIPVGWQADGGQVASLNIKEHSCEISVMLHDVTGVKAGGVRARIAGPTDISGRMVLDLDLDEAPWSAAVAVVAGFNGVAIFGVNPEGTGIQVPLICEKVRFSGSTDKELMWDTDMKANSLAGVIVYPGL